MIPRDAFDGSLSPATIYDIPDSSNSSNRKEAGNNKVIISLEGTAFLIRDHTHCQHETNMLFGESMDM
jgi:hypothetical protein